MNLERDKFTIVKLYSDTRLELNEARDFNRDFESVAQAFQVHNRINRLEQQLKVLTRLWILTLKTDGRYRHIPPSRMRIWLEKLAYKQELEHQRMLDHPLDD